MKVYLVETSEEYSLGWDYLGVFSTKEKAQEVANRFNSRLKMPFDQDKAYVEEFELDRDYSKK